MPPYWRRNGGEGPELIRAALAEAPALQIATHAFDRQLMVLSSHASLHFICFYPKHAFLLGLYIAFTLFCCIL